MKWVTGCRISPRGTCVKSAGLNQFFRPIRRPLPASFALLAVRTEFYFWEIYDFFRNPISLEIQFPSEIQFPPLLSARRA
jgi:hypothetical protein